jgi:hypothetical protein
MRNVTGTACRRLLALAAFTLSTGVASAQPLLFDSAKAAKPCTCDDLKARLAETKKEGEIYKDLYKEGTRFDSFADLNAEVGERMGWINIYSVGKGGSEATEADRQSATQKCLATGTCDWICIVAINNVHEKYHDWWDVKGVSTPHVVSRAIGDTTQSWKRGVQGKLGPTQWRKTRDKMRSEIGAHDLEAQFLRDTIQDAMRDNKCKGIDASPLQKELEDRFERARDRTEDYVRSIQP